MHTDSCAGSLSRSGKIPRRAAVAGSVVEEGFPEELRYLEAVGDELAGSLHHRLEVDGVDARQLVETQQDDACPCLRMTTLAWQNKQGSLKHMPGT